MSAGDKETAGEKVARRRVEARVGPLQRADVSGREGAPDYWSDDAPPRRIALEVTSLVDAAGLRQRGAIAASRTVDCGTSRSWLVNLRRHVNVRRLRGSIELRELMLRAEAVGLDWLPNGTTPIELEKLMDEVGIEHAYAAAAAPLDGPALVYLSGGSASASGWQGRRIDEFMLDLFEGGISVPEQWIAVIASRVEKLVRAEAGRSHLYVWLDTTTEAGLAIYLELGFADEDGAAPYELPTYDPPAPLTDVWLWPDTPRCRGLYWERGVGWTVVRDPEGGLDGQLRARRLSPLGFGGYAGDPSPWLDEG